MKKLTLVILMLALSSCLKTRSELGGMEQENVYGEKMAANQMDAQGQKPVIPPDAAVPTAPPDEKDELIRALNGRVEVLENQLQTIMKEREEEKKQNEQRLTLLQEALVKLENEIHPPAEDKSADKKPDAPAGEGMESSDDLAKKDKAAKNEKSGKTETKKSDKKMTPLEAGEDYFAKQDWKKAILSFNQYTDESPKGKHVPDAKYKIGVCFQQLGMKEEAMAYFEEVAANYGATEAGKKSKARLAKLKK
ncbi:MAG: hypothetical protein K0R29_1795 [Pseudobdellovibrio sp.]|nr:hypothetical protein [Pseudobdellovibrio sp.]